ncbi:hypothetical protein ISCGN_028250 [Ixodes scapularis]
MAPHSSKPRSGQAFKRRCIEPKTIDKDPEVETFTKFFIVHSLDEHKPVAKLSPFVVAKVLENLVGFSYKAKKQHSGDLLVEVTTKKQNEAILKLTSFLDVKVSVSPHRTLNTIRGVLSEDDFLHTSEEELLEGLQVVGVVAVKLISKKMVRKSLRNTSSLHLNDTHYQKPSRQDTLTAASAHMSPTLSGASVASALATDRAAVEGRRRAQSAAATTI